MMFQPWFLMFDFLLQLSSWISTTIRFIVGHISPDGQTLLLMVLISSQQTRSLTYVFGLLKSKTYQVSRETSNMINPDVFFWLDKSYIILSEGFYFDLNLLCEYLCLLCYLIAVRLK